MKEANPEASWWIKGDGVDVVKGLFESTKGLWSGDVDLDDAALKQKFREMCERLSFVRGLGLSSRRSVTGLKDDLRVFLEKSEEDSKFILEGICMCEVQSVCLCVHVGVFFVVGEHCYYGRK